MSYCKALKMMKEQIDNGGIPEEVIPYSLPQMSDEDYLEVLYYAKSVITDDNRRKVILDKLEELQNASRRNSQL